MIKFRHLMIKCQFFDTPKFETTYVFIIKAELAIPREKTRIPGITIRDPGIFRSGPK